MMRAAGCCLRISENCFDPAHHRHAQVHQSDIGIHLVESLNRLPAVARLGHNRHIGLAVYHRGKPFAHDRVIVDNHYAYRTLFAHP